MGGPTEKMIELLLQYGGFGILALFFLWDKKDANKRYDKLFQQNADNQTKMLEIEKQSSERIARLENNLQYNMMCPLLRVNDPAMKSPGNNGTEIMR